MNVKDFLKNLAFLCFALNLKGRFIINNFRVNDGLLNFISILQSLGIEITLKSDTITLNSHGAMHLFYPNEAIDVKGEPALVYAFCGLFASLDYTVFFVDSTKNLANHHFSGLILGLNEVGARFTYSKDFALPISIKGTSNFLPMKHSIIKENPFLELAFLTLGMQGMGKTHLFSDFNYGFEEILNQLNANFIYKPEEIAVSLQSQTLSKQLEITL